MNAYDATTPSEMLMAFLEGDLEGSHEDILFSLLSDDHALRIEMRELIAVNRLARLDAGMMIPPSAWKGNVMKGIAGVGSVKEDRKGNRLFPAGWYRTGAIPLVSLLIGVIGTLMIVRSTDDAERIGASSNQASASNDNDMVRGNSSETLSLVQGTGGSNHSTPSDIAADGNFNARKKELFPTNSDPNPTISPLIEDHRMPHDDHQNRAVDNAEVSTLRGEELESAAVLSHDPVDEDDVSAALNSADDVGTIGSFLLSPSTPDLNVRHERIEVGYRHSLGSNYPNVAIPSTAGRGIGEISLSLLYRLGNHHRVGLEAGRGNFPQVFRGIENGEQVRYEQNPTLLWYGIAYQYTTDPILFDGLHPFARLIGGGTTAGPLARGILGLRFVPESRVAFTAGVEGSLMFYEFQKNRFTSSGLDFTYGVSFAF